MMIFGSPAISNWYIKCFYLDFLSEILHCVFLILAIKLRILFIVSHNIKLLIF
jgi:hypothetical protein